jgi:hypothetical protein
MPTPTYDLIASSVLGSASATVTFSSIPATYRDLVLVSNPLSTVSSSNFYAEFNGDTGGGSTYPQIFMQGNGSTASSGIFGAGDLIAGLAQSGSVNILQIFDYSATDKHKTTIFRGENAAVRAIAAAGRWANTAAITTIDIKPFSGSFDTGSTFYLYGIVS